MGHLPGPTVFYPSRAIVGLFYGLDLPGRFGGLLLLPFK